MTWMRTDDGFPEHPKADALAAHFDEDWATLAVAFTTWHHMACDCAARETDGVFLAARAYRVIRAPREAIDKALDGLVAVGLLERKRGEFTFHDWADYQPTREQLVADRKAKAERQARWRSGKQRVGDARVDASTAPSHDASTAPSVTRLETLPRPVPSRPVPSHSPEDTSCLSPPAAATVASASPVSAATGDPFVLTPPVEAPAENTRAKARQRPAKAPPPFSVADALSAVAAAAGGRFVAGDATTWTKASMIATAGLVRRFPDLAEWSLVGEWLAAGGGGAGTKGFAWAASNAFPEAVAKARAWRDDGRPALLDARGFPVRPAPPPERDPTDPWAAADAALDAHFAARRRAGGGL